MGYQLREEPLTLAEINKTENRFIEEVIPVDLDVAINNDYESFLDCLEYQLIGDQGVLTDIEYSVVGNGMYDMLHIKVSGYVDLMGED